MGAVDSHRMPELVTDHVFMRLITISAVAILNASTALAAQPSPRVLDHLRQPSDSAAVVVQDKAQ